MKPPPPIYKMIGGLLVMLVLPFVLVLAAALFGIGNDDSPDLASWLMGFLTGLGAVAVIASIADCIRGRRIDWFWSFITASATIFWGSVFLQSLG